MTHRPPSPAELPADTAARLVRAAALRAGLPESGTTYYRAAHTTETAGLYALDMAARVGILSLYRELSAGHERQLAEVCAGVLGLTSIYLKRRPPEARHLANVQRETLAPPGPLLGPPQTDVTVLEDGVPYLIRPGGDLSTGLFGDARPARRWVRANAGGRVLNTFAYTCGFGLNAALAGAASVKNLDLSRRVLAWGQENYALSGLSADPGDFIYGDVFDWLTRLERRAEVFELLILDPPSFARSRAGTWRSERDYPRLAAQAARLLAPGGRLLALNNHAGVSAQSFERMLGQGAPHLRVTERFGAGEDYPGATHLKVVVAERMQ